MKKHPGYTKIDEIPVVAGDQQTVDIHLHGNIIKSLAQFSEPDDPEFVAALSNLLLIQMNAFSVDETLAVKLKPSIATFENRLKKRGWENVLRVRDHEEQVDIFIKYDDQSCMIGLVLLAFDGNADAVFVNFVGDLDWHSAKRIGEKFDIKQIKCLDDYGLRQ
ncbi:MAG: DUF4252 domain-containing protein [candidate division KSB1 bacterium]|nr:DUF4252 domain-containing protein [candidate division KSB1 bacterium]MDZ7358647.1 DUF4252 domain-containing protein [candidate division KSB1 bacterium]